ncbi:CotY/CotZ family spore coat protein [Neobacillus sp. SM06]|uniref:CotY/CotZ family spore coat protein n=1 Tax=Neobacillus sp. SM06 TaxID=3422492 RepID=UPI003D2D77D2
MSCGTEFYTSNCVCDTLLAIVEAQDRVDNGCSTSCNRAIQELVGGVTTGGTNTIPVILTCKDTCLPYIGFGALRVPLTATFTFPISTIFRVVEVDPETCCATLELLSLPTPLDATGALDLPAIFTALTGATLVGTGACITVDLNCFCAVTCLPPIEI